MPNTSRQFISLILGVIFIGSCVYRPVDIAPMHAVKYLAPNSSGKSLVVFFPGYRDRAEAFQTHDFIELLNRYYPQVDSVALDAHIGYLENRTLVRRVYEDVISPAIDQGYEKITLVGISMGGFGVLWTGYELRKHIDSIVLIAPFLGDTNVLDEIENHGSISAWVKTFKDQPDRDQMAWFWLDSLLADEKFRRSITLIYGSKDHLAPLANYLAKKLPENRVFTNGGAHKWKDWTPLWETVLSNKLL